MMPRFSIQRGLAFVLRKQPFSAMKVKEVKEAPPPKRANIHLAVDKPHEGKTLREIIRLPPSALQGLAEHSDKFLGGFDIRSIKDLGKWKEYHAAKAISELAAKEDTGMRRAASLLSIDKCLHQKYACMSFKELLAQPPSALLGLSLWDVDSKLEKLDIRDVDSCLAELHIKTIDDLANWKFAATARSIVTLAMYEPLPRKAAKPKTEQEAKKE